MGRFFFGIDHGHNNSLGADIQGIADLILLVVAHPDDWNRLSAPHVGKLGTQSLDLDRRMLGIELQKVETGIGEEVSLTPDVRPCTDGSFSRLQLIFDKVHEIPMVLVNTSLVDVYAWPSLNSFSQIRNDCQNTGEKNYTGQVWFRISRYRESEV